ncbi:MAG: AmmeMemoRadiSam system radical SAM enzyme [Limnochordia bacterium]|nr:AmmeMemoRadiSam system radical SAM enzyme [Limnochordia bacterium]
MDKVSRYQRRSEDSVRCMLCPHYCLLHPGERGRCVGRQNNQGRLISSNYGQVAALALDPIEKKPLYHFHPGGQILSLGTTGCNFRCSFCQNWEISQRETTTKYYDPEEIVVMAEGLSDCLGLAFTYSEPMIWYDFVYDTAMLAKNANLNNILITNGFVNKKPLQRLLQCIDGVNLDIKSFSPDFYRKYCGGMLSAVLDSAIVIKEQCHLEITYLIIPDLNDDADEITKFSYWVADNLGQETPVHFTRYFPEFRLSLSPTPVETLWKAKELAERVLEYVYLGNVADGSGTYCPECGRLVITREGYRISSILEDDKCPECGRIVVYS